MAKEHRDPKSAKMRIFFGFAEVEGGDQTIQEGVRSVAAAVVRAVQNHQPVRVVKALPSAPVNGSGKTDEATLFDPPTDPLDQQDGAIDDADVLDAQATVTDEDKVDRKDSKPKRPPTYSFVPDLNLHPASKTSLRDFFAEKKPREQQAQVAVFVYYLAKTLGITGITANHLYQCFDAVGKKVPKDILMVARNTEKRKGWVDASDGKNVRITTPGENFVKLDLPPKVTPAS